ncbi:MAG: IclR family transcriptional regulator [Chloroflexota bacterium]|nr:IclR family transcriptional regulator [Chloroflexota bacterium]
MGHDEPDGGRALQKAMEVLALFAPDRPEMSAAQVSRLLNWPKSTSARLLAGMQRSGFLDRDGLTGQYRVGIRLAALGALALHGTSLQRLAQPELEALVRQTDETANVAVLSGQEVVNVAMVLTPRPIKHMGWIGRRMPIHATAAGKALVAWLGDGADSLLTPPLPAFTSRTVTDMGQFREELASVRAAGGSCARGEYEEDLLGVGAPIRDHLGEVIAAVTISAPVYRVPEERIAEIGPQVRAAAQRISAALGYVVVGPADKSSRRQPGARRALV